MKGRESGMPEEAYWQSFFDADGVLETLFSAGTMAGDLVEFGCGYGTFTLPAARRTHGMVTALDIEPQMVDCVRRKAEAQGLSNVRAQVRDFVSQGTGLDTGSQAHAMIFNLLHLEQPQALLREAHRVLRDAGIVSIMHWRSDIPTPRGPSLDIRPRPEECQSWLQAAGFVNIELVNVQAFCPYHFALIARR
ncbi:MAG: methyltransferase type 11 [Pseudomonadales bacterium RIFCSPLOWO2_12_59_9]|nr:MAG: methyltransferase type 11 [Pseudomonadales bacterium RIFCSPLOWO2_12_59_9]